jgi:hypothetical protein
MCFFVPFIWRPLNFVLSESHPFYSYFCVICNLVLSLINFPPLQSLLFCMLQTLIDALQSSDVPKKESCLALNLLFQFLFKELKNGQKVRRWFRHKLSLEFEELLTRTTTGKLFDCVSVSRIYY